MVRDFYGVAGTPAASRGEGVSVERSWSFSVRPEKFKFLEKGQNHNFGYEIIISVKKTRNLFFRSLMTKRILLLESSHEI